MEYPERVRLMSLPTKYYSNRQEAAVADFLGWKRTSASGARPFDKGDIQSEEYCGECKTFCREVASISFKYSDWQKICKEALSCMKKPVLFTDDGSQKVENTYCIVPTKFCIFPDGRTINYRVASSSCHFGVSEKRITVAKKAVEDALSGGFDGVTFCEWGDQLCIMRLSTFKSMLDGD
jgi:hypothetical protein